MCSRRILAPAHALGLLLGPVVLLLLLFPNWRSRPELIVPTILGDPSLILLSGITLFLPIAIWLRRPRQPGPLGAATSVPGRRQVVIGFLVCAMAGTLCAALPGWPLRDLPPLYHDEYSYLFQARTFLRGRCVMPALDQPASFEQPHVLTEPVFASRYYPGTGIYLAPFVALGWPIAGIWVAAGLTAGFSFLAGARWSIGAGYLAGLTCAALPGMIIFGNLLLSSGPAMFYLAAFLAGYVRLFDRPRCALALGTGLAIGLAFLTRPLTAVGIGLPFATYAMWRAWRAPPIDYARTLGWLIAGFAIGPVGLLGFNLATTCNPLRSLYGVYMTTKTPCQQYGFYNRTRGLPRRTAMTFVPYDDWAEELTPAKSLDVTAKRWINLTQWSLGPILMGLLMAGGLCRLARLGDRDWLLLLALCGLTLAYVPYWFTGLLGFSYLAEALPIIALLLGVVMAPTIGTWWRLGEFGLAGWLGLSIVLLLAWQTIHATRLALQPGSELVFPRLQAMEIRRLEEAALAKSPKILVLVDAKPADSLHATFVHNDPDLQGPVLRAWNPGEASAFLINYHVDRAVYLLRPPTESRPAELELLGPARVAR